MCQYVRLMRKQFKDVCFLNTAFPVPTYASRKVGQFVRLINPLNAKPIILHFYYHFISYYIF